MPEAATTEFW
jgi:2,4'-dihydroxyacetophenone dioxygenase